jgi:hypothetical protein
VNIRDWIEDVHLSAAATLTYRRALSGGDRHAAVLDGFLKPGKLAALRAAFAGDGQFSMMYGLLDRDPHDVSAEVYANADPAIRFYKYLTLSGPAAGRPMMPGYLAHRLFSTMTSTPEWLAWLGAIAGENLAVRTGVHARIMTGDMLMAPHSDRGHGVICAVLYLNEGWSPAFGGRFVQTHEHHVVTIDPLPNRLLLFSPARRTVHGVAPLSAAMGDWQRWSYSLWYDVEPKSGADGA